MRITKYAQSCFLIETSGKRILIDPGKYSWDGENIPEEWHNSNLILITHFHSDHCDSKAVKQIIENSDNPKIITVEQVAGIIKKESEIEERVILVNEGDTKEFDSIKIQAVKAVHGFHPKFMAKRELIPKQNIGFIIDDGDTRLYHAGDIISFEADDIVQADVFIVPICGHGVVMEPSTAVEFCDVLKAKLVIPMHYDSEKHPLGTDEFEENIKKTDLKYKILKPGESIEV